MNALGTKHVAEVCQALNIPLVYLSTDYVFDGTKQDPYTESDVPNPLSAYGRSKLEGEKIIEFVLKTGRFYIVRTAWLYGRHGRNFVKAILEKAQRGEALQIVADQVGSPTYAMDLAKAIMSLIDGAPFGTYHLTNSGSCSWYEFARKILTMAGLKQYRLTPITSKDLGRLAHRPSNSVLANGNWRKIAGQDLRSWQSALSEALFTRSDWELV